MLKTILTQILIIIFLTSPVFATVMQAGISQSHSKIIPSIVLDKTTQLPIPNAKITVPSINYSTTSNQHGEFSIPQNIKNNSFLAVEKANYKPFSITISQSNTATPLTLRIEKSNELVIKIDSTLRHLGDDNFSQESANAYQFKTKTLGPTYIKTFIIPSQNLNKNNYLVFGSIIGIDTALAKGLRQNRITTAFASPPSIYLNGVKIAEIKINGDNQKVKLPNQLIKWNQQNQIIIKAGINLAQTAYTDYDDFEFMNLSVQVF